MQRTDHAILYVITQLDLGGAQKVCLSLHNHNKKAGIASYIITGSHGLLTSSVKHDPSIITLTSFRREIGFLSIIQEIKSFVALIRLIRGLHKKHPKLIVHTHSTKAGIIGRWAAFFARAPIRIHTIHGFAFHNHQNKFARLCIMALEWATSFITRHFVCVSRADQTTGSNFLPGFKHKNTLIRAAIDGRFYEQNHTPAYPMHDAPFIIGSIACFKPQKNIIDTLQAFSYAHHKNPQLRLEIIGDGEQRTMIESWINSHNLNHAITLLGWQPSVLEHLSRWHLFVLTSLWEGLPCAVVEAQRMHIPVVAYTTGGIPEIISHGVNGYLAEQGDWQKIGHYLHALSVDKDLYEKLQARSKPLQEFHESSMHKQHLDLYCSVSTHIGK